MQEELIENPHEKFFREMWSKHCNGELDFQDGTEVLNLALSLGLVKEEPYDQDIHGQSGVIEWDLEKGDPWYVLVKPQPPSGDVVDWENLTDTVAAELIKELKLPYGAGKDEDIRKALHVQIRVEIAEQAAMPSMTMEEVVDRLMTHCKDEVIEVSFLNRRLPQLDQVRERFRVMAEGFVAAGVLNVRGE